MSTCTTLTTSLLRLEDAARLPSLRGLDRPQISAQQTAQGLGPTWATISPRTRACPSQLSESAPVCTPLPRTPLCGAAATGTSAPRQRRCCSLSVLSKQGQSTLLMQGPLVSDNLNAACTDPAGRRTGCAPLRRSGARLRRRVSLVGAVLNSEHDYLAHISMFPLGSFCRSHVHSSSSMYITLDMYWDRK